jgi:hypothetical protein
VLQNEQSLTPFVERRRQTSRHKQQIAFHEPHGNRVADGFQDAQPGSLGQSFLAALLLLLCLECCIGLCPLLLLWVMHRAFGIGAHLAEFTFLCAIGNDGLGNEFACLVFRRVLLRFVLRSLLPDFDILATRDNRAAFGGFSVGSCDLYQLRFRGYRLLNMRVYLGRIAGRIGALCGIWANCKSFLLALRRRAHRVRRGHPT